MIEENKLQKMGSLILNNEKKECLYCFKVKELVCCDECMRRLIVERVSESIQGDIVNRVKFIFDEKIDELRQEIKEFILKNNK